MKYSVFVVLLICFNSGAEPIDDIKIVYEEPAAKCSLLKSFKNPSSKQANADFSYELKKITGVNVNRFEDSSYYLAKKLGANLVYQNRQTLNATQLINLKEKSRVIHLSHGAVLTLKTSIYKCESAI